MKSIFKTKPDDAMDKGASFDKHKKFLVTGVRQMAKTYNSPQSAVWFFMDLKHKFPGDAPEDQKLGSLLWVCENEMKWKKHFSSEVSDLKRVIMGTCYVEVTPQGSPQALVFQAAKGKAKDKDIKKKLRAITKKLGVQVRIVRGPEAQEEPDPSDAQDAQSDNLDTLQMDIKDLYSELGKLSKPLTEKQLPDAEEMQKLMNQFKDALKSVTDAKLKQQFSPFATQIASWEKKLQDVLAKVKAKAQAGAEALKGAFTEIWSRIEKLYKDNLQSGAALTGEQAKNNAIVQKAMELRQGIQQLEKEYLKLPSSKQSAAKKHMSSAREWLTKCMEFLRQQPKEDLQKANAGAKEQASKTAEKLKSGILNLTKKLNINDGIQFNETADAQLLQRRIEDFRLAVQNATQEVQTSMQAFFEQVKKLRNKLNLELGKAQQNAAADMPKIIEQQQKDLQKAEQLAQELDIFNMHI